MEGHKKSKKGVISRGQKVYKVKSLRLSFCPQCGLASLWWVALRDCFGRDEGHCASSSLCSSRMKKSCLVQRRQRVVQSKMIRAGRSTLEHIDK